MSTGVKERSSEAAEKIVHGYLAIPKKFGNFKRATEKLGLFRRTVNRIWLLSLVRTASKKREI